MMQLGVHFANFAVAPRPGGLGETLAETARTAEAGGCAWFTMMDHWFQMEQMGGGAGDPMLEGYTSLGFVLSGGRAMLGIGAAWYEREHLGLGVPYPPVAERFERLEETLQICQQMWGPDNGPFAGRHYQLAETLCVPAPVHQPRPPIMIGGTGAKKTLRLVAKYADASNMFALGADALAAKLDILARHCEAEGRDRPRSARPSSAAATRSAIRTASCGAWKGTRSSVSTSSRSYPSRATRSGSSPSSARPSCPA
jgi:alkanesulfonate monooxygenase SsuD/methylene tetrahydromethanopterin reductase-like flavin-dependent oxidoreductase (luciferase family)